MNYEKKYKEALERARVYHTGGSISDDHITEVIFPELKENEDERIRKEIIDFIGLPHPQFVGKRDHEKWIAWLEKQDKKLDADKVIAWIVANICDFEYYVKWFKKDFGL